LRPFNERLLRTLSSGWSLFLSPGEREEGERGGEAPSIAVRETERERERREVLSKETY